VHLAQQRHQQRRLPRPGGADDEVECSLLEHQVVLDAEAEALLGGSETAIGDLLLRPGERGVAEADVRGVCGRGIECRGAGDLRVEGVEELSLHRGVSKTDSHVGTERSFERA
jgi:hypothetical protein